VAETLALIDYGAGNLHSVHSALQAAGAGEITVTRDAAIVRNADRIVLPGVGAFKHCMDNLAAIDGMIAALHTRVADGGAPFLGICVGMQLLADKGAEHGDTPGLGWIGGTVQPIERDDPAIKIPHMGWNVVEPRDDAALVEAGEAYFLHGYHFEVADGADVIAITDHGGPLVAAVGRNNIVGVQFHPEKSQSYGIATLQRFLEWKP